MGRLREVEVKRDLEQEQLEGEYRRLIGPRPMDPPELAEEVEASITRERVRLQAEGASLTELVEGLRRFFLCRAQSDGWAPEREAAAQRRRTDGRFNSLHGGIRQGGTT